MNAFIGDYKEMMKAARESGAYMLPAYFATRFSDAEPLFDFVELGERASVEIKIRGK